MHATSADLTHTTRPGEPAPPMQSRQPSLPDQSLRSAKSWWSSLKPLQVMVGLLLVLLVLASVSWGDWRLNPGEWLQVGVSGALLYLAGSAMQWMLQKFGVIPSRQKENRWITTLILLLLFAPDVPWWGFVVLGAVTELFQRVCRLPSGPWLNPAAAGAVIVAMMVGHLGVLATWWGVSFSPRWYVVEEGLSIASLLLVPVAIWVAQKYKKLVTVVALLVAACASYWLVFGMAPTYLLFEGTLLFFALVMAVEPKTSPVLWKDQIWFGGLVGVMLSFLLKLYFVEAYGGALLIGNLAWNGTRWWKFRQIQLTRQSVKTAK